MILLVISLILLVGCPIFLIIYWAIQIISGRRNSSRTANWVVLILWLAGLFMFASVGTKTLLHFKNLNGHPITLNWTEDDSPIMDEVRDCEQFNEIDVTGNIEVVLSQDSLQMVTISAPSDCLSNVKTEVNNGVLTIFTDQIFLNRKIKAHISTKELEKITAKGACEIENDSDFSTQNLSLELIGASKADLMLQIADKLEVDIKGASKLELIGSGTTFKAQSLGASDIRADKFIAKNVEIDASGASHARVYASESFVADATGASNIECKGNPKYVKKSDSLGSDIRVIK